MSALILWSYIDVADAEMVENMKNVASADQELSVRSESPVRSVQKCYRCKTPRGE
jgi:hypothetical protein